MFVLSIEPEGDVDVISGIVKPLSGDVPSDAQDHVVYDLMDQSSTLPAGTVPITHVVADDGGGESSLLLWTGLGVLIVVVVAVAGIMPQRNGK